MRHSSMARSGIGWSISIFTHLDLPLLSLSLSLSLSYSVREYVCVRVCPSLRLRLFFFSFLFSVFVRAHPSLCRRCGNSRSHRPMRPLIRMHALSEEYHFPFMIDLVFPLFLPSFLKNPSSTHTHLGLRSRVNSTMKGVSPSPLLRYAHARSIYCFFVFEFLPLSTGEA